MTLFRIAGKLQDGRTFTNRIEADNALDASATVKADLQESGIDVTDIREIVTRPVEASKTGIYIGSGRKGKKADASETKPAKKAKK